MLIDHQITFVLIQFQSYCFPAFVSHESVLVDHLLAFRNLMHMILNHMVRMHRSSIQELLILSSILVSTSESVMEISPSIIGIPMVHAFCDSFSLSYLVGFCTMSFSLLIMLNWVSLLLSSPKIACLHVSFTAYENFYKLSKMYCHLVLIFNFLILRMSEYRNPTIKHISTYTLVSSSIITYVSDLFQGSNPHSDIPFLSPRAYPSVTQHTFPTKSHLDSPSVSP